MKAFFTIEAIFVIFLLPFLLYFAVTASSVSAKTKLAEKAKMELAYDVLSSWDRGGVLDYSHADALMADTYRLSRESGQCLTLRGTARRMTDGCEENICAFRTIVSDDYGLKFDRIFVCVE